MIRKVLITTLILFFVISASAFAQIKIGYMNTQEVLNKLPERERITKQLQDFVQQKQSQLSQEAADYQDAVAEYQETSSSLSAQQRKAKEQNLTDMETSLNELDQSIRLEVQQKRQELLQPIFARIDAAISTVAESKDLDFVLNKSTNAGDNIVFYASSGQIDITQEVLNNLLSSNQ